MNNTSYRRIYELTWGIAQLELINEMTNWIKGAMHRQLGIPWRGGHDEARYVCTWGDYYKLTGDESVKNFLLWLRDSYLEWSDKNQYHGFQAEANEHSNHSFENAEEFIAAMCDMDPNDKISANRMEDIAHHVGNWVEGIPSWYDWVNHRFVSHWLGTKNVRNYPPYDVELAGHSRIGSIILYAYRYSKNKRYLNWCKDYADKWVEIIRQSEDRIPMITYSDRIAPEDRMDVYNFGRETFGEPYMGKLWLNITEHAVRFILKVYEVTKEQRYLMAVRKAIKIYTGKKDKEDLTNLYILYKEVTGENIYKDELMSWYNEEILPSLCTEQILPNCLIITREKGRSFGFKDDNGNITAYRGPSVMMLLKGYKVTGNIECLTRAMPLAAKQLNLVTYSTRDGREHGCASHKFIHGIGEEAASILYYITGIDDVSYYKEDGTLGLEDGIAVMCDLYSSEPKFYFFNSTEKKKIVKIAFRKPEFEFEKVEINGKLSSQVSKGTLMIELEHGKVSEVKVK